MLVAADTPTLQDITERLERLEKKVAALGEVVGMGVQGLTGEAVLGRIQAEEFVMKDAKGRMRGAMSVMNDAPTIALYEAEGEGRVILRIEKEGAALYLGGKDGRHLAAMKVESGGATLSVSDNEDFCVLIGHLDRISREKMKALRVSPSPFPQAIIVMQGNKAIWSAPPPPARKGLFSRLFRP
jgi:hypothetical protein